MSNLSADLMITYRQTWKNYRKFMGSKEVPPHLLTSKRNIMETKTRQKNKNKERAKQKSFPTCSRNISTTPANSSTALSGPASLLVPLKERPLVGNPANCCG